MKIGAFPAMTSPMSPLRLCNQVAKKIKFSGTRRKLEGEKRLHLACGNNVVEGWANIDFRTGAEVIGWDLTDPLPVSSGCIEFIFCEHFIEHVTLKQAAALLGECNRVLMPGGIMRLSTPSLSKLLDEYLAGRTSEWHDVAWRPASPCQMLNESFRLWGHQFIYDANELRRLIEGAGFGKVEPVSYRESQSPALRNMECRPNHGELIFEATK